MKMLDVYDIGEKKMVEEADVQSQRQAFQAQVMFKCCLYAFMYKFVPY